MCNCIVTYDQPILSLYPCEPQNHNLMFVNQCLLPVISLPV